MAMATEQRKTRGELRAMFWHDFAGTIADNMVEAYLRRRQITL